MLWAPPAARSAFVAPPSPAPGRETAAFGNLTARCTCLMILQLQHCVVWRASTTASGAAQLAAARLNVHVRPKWSLLPLVPLDDGCHAALKVVEQKNLRVFANIDRQTVHESKRQEPAAVASAYHVAMPHAKRRQRCISGSQIGK